MSSDPIIGVLLAGGKSRRFGGGDKCLAPLAGTPMLTRAITRLETQVDGLILNANNTGGVFDAFELPIAPDPIEGFVGPLAGVLAGMGWAEQNRKARWVASVAGDTPLFPQDLVARLRDAVGERYPAIALAACDGQIHPTFGLWPTALATDLREALSSGTRRIVSWTDQHDCTVVEFEKSDLGGQMLDPFFNINTQQDLETAEAVLAGADN